MQAAAKLNISITVSPVGSDLPTSGTATVSSIDRTMEWQPTLTLDEDGYLHQLRAAFLQVLDASTRKLLLKYCTFHFIVAEFVLGNIIANDLIWFFPSYAAKLNQNNLQQSPQQNALVPLMQECVDAISEHQRLQALMKGEWVKGLLPQSSVRADYTVKRIRGNGTICNHVYHLILISISSSIDCALNYLAC